MVTKNGGSHNGRVQNVYALRTELRELVEKRQEFADVLYRLKTAKEEGKDPDLESDLQEQLVGLNRDIRSRHQMLIEGGDRGFLNLFRWVRPGNYVILACLESGRKNLVKLVCSGSKVSTNCVCANTPLGMCLDGLHEGDTFCCAEGTITGYHRVERIYRGICEVPRDLLTLTGD